MKRALLISIHPKWAEKIMNGEKTIEVRSWIPKDYVGWVYVAITKDNYKNHLYKKDDIWTLTDKHIYHYPYKNICGKVAFRFFVWRESFVKIVWEDGYYFICSPMYDGAKRWLNKSCITKEELYKYGRKRDLYAWHIDKLEIFDKPKELSEFYRGYDILGNEPKPYLTHQITKAPQKCAWVYTKE
jgi:predicted transcriptional regulator